MKETSRDINTHHNIYFVYYSKSHIDFVLSYYVNLQEMHQNKFAMMKEQDDINRKTISELYAKLQTSESKSVSVQVSITVIMIYCMITFTVCIIIMMS